MLALDKVCRCLHHVLNLSLAGAREDATGENPDGVDITSVLVSNNDEGLITFRINISSRPALTGDMRGRVWVDPGQVTCVAKIGAKPLEPSSERFLGSRATCVFVIPPGAKGQTLRGSITIAFGGRQVKRSFSRQIE